MNLENDTFYSRIPTPSNDELFNYITNYSRYKEEAVQLAITELRSRGVILSRDELANIEAFFSAKANHTRRPRNVNPSLFPPMQNPLGYDPLDTKKYLRELEVYGGKSNILATEFREWFAGLWQGKNLSYTIASISLLISVILWFVGSRKESEPHKNAVSLESDQVNRLK
jgi:hypothetical protein